MRRISVDVSYQKLSLNPSKLSIGTVIENIFQCPSSCVTQYTKRLRLHGRFEFLKSLISDTVNYSASLGSPTRIHLPSSTVTKLLTDGCR